MLIVSVAANEHDSSVAVADDERVIVVVEAERLTRVKRGWSDASGLHDLVTEALRYSGRSPADVTHWCGTVMGNTLVPPEDRRCETTKVMPVSLFGTTVRFIAVNHHLAHAASGFFTSPFESAIIDACDAGGDGRQHAMFRGSRGSRGSSLEEVGPFDRSRFSGVFYDVCSYYLFKRYLQEGRFMGLAAYGDPDPDGTAWLEARVEELSTQPHEVSYHHLDSRFGIDSFAAEDPRCRSFARSVQTVFEKRRLDQLSVVADGEDLVLTGGAALNIHANTRIREARSAHSRVFVPPCCDDSGQSLGALLYVANVILGIAPRVELPFLGLGRSDHAGSLSDDVADQVTSDLLGGMVVAWHWGRAEIGPRALGHRSLLCSPETVDHRILVSETVKRREPYRPVAPIILKDHRREWFRGKDESPYMLFASHAEDRARMYASGAVHADGTARLQTVDDGHVLAKVLERFRAATGVPMLINTSLNGPGEPICQTTADTLRFCRDKPQVVAYTDGTRWAPGQWLR